jgi:hypothetical protein
LDDILSIWLAHPDPATDAKLWQDFKDEINDFHGLEWTFTERTKTDVVFMDMSLSIERDKIVSTIYEKTLALYLYIPPHSAHPPGVLAGLIMGNTLRIHQLCTNDADIEEKLDTFFDRLLNRGHQQSTLLPIFLKAIDNAKSYLLRSEEESATIKDDKEEASKRRVYLHLQYNPDDPSSKVIQSLWRRHVSSPSGELPLNEMTNNAGKEIEVDQLTIAYHRAPNLGNLLSYRKIAKRTGSKVSSFC